MSKKNFDAEQKAEELLMALGRELGESRAAYGEALLDDIQSEPPLFVEVEKTTAKPRGKRRIFRRAIILAAALIVVMGLAAVVSEGVKLKISSLFFEDAPGSTAIMDNTKAVIDVADIEVGYVPEGFQLVSDEVVGDFLREMEYKSEEETTFAICITKTEQYGANVDNEHTKQQEIRINDKQGYLFSYDEKNIILWQMGDCTLQVIAGIETETLHEIAENIIVK